MPTASWGRPVPLSDSSIASTPARQVTCTSCAGGRLRPDRANTALWRGSELIVIENIPALVCQTCGERYFEDETALVLDRMRGRQGGDGPPARVLSVPVFPYAPPSDAPEEET